MVAAEQTELLIAEAKPISPCGNVTAVGTVPYQRNLATGDDVGSFVIADFLRREQIEIIDVHVLDPKGRLSRPAMKSPPLESLSETQVDATACFPIPVSSPPENESAGVEANRPVAKVRLGKVDSEPAQVGPRLKLDSQTLPGSEKRTKPNELGETARHVKQIKILQVQHDGADKAAVAVACHRSVSSK